MEVIKVHNLYKSYGNVQVVKDISLTVKKGEIFGLLGANGAGKSTTIECILGTKNFDDGQVSILGMNPQKERKQLFQKVGVQFQESNYQDKITVKELCEITEVLYKNPLDCNKLLEQFHLQDKVRNLVSELSGGEKQRLFIILALIPNPEVVFLDELTTGLDVKVRRDVWKCLLNLKKQGLTLFLTSHFMDEVEALCNKICILKNGVIDFYGTAEEVVALSPYKKFEDAYLWFVDEEELDDESI
ncbi:ABC transporter ATP-binding protein [Clostridium frigidicarnis]|uniref:ABC-2 type transport system ATP-binding protein n=1 Tax=Clostridium frigidicarnis TaxID=84698 RepID=A0A1I1A5F2_9CLOT|nr:ABC transporter ATP-binding protein [Clostridium frigidicarnis]SFB33189.1 ABC-2 type transport system ATP-binding protein [Clostridium frigidicarnis]